MRVSLCSVLEDVQAPLELGQDTDERAQQDAISVRLADLGLYDRGVQGRARATDERGVGVAPC